MNYPQNHKKEENPGFLSLGGCDVGLCAGGLICCGVGGDNGL